MQLPSPTYSIAEILERLPLLGTAELLLLKSLIDEEVHYYSASQQKLLLHYILAFFKIESQREQMKHVTELAARLDSIYRKITRLNQ